MSTEPSDFASVLGSHDRAVATRAGYGRRMGLGRRPVLLVVDVTYEFCGTHARPVLDDIATRRRSCGESAWAAIRQIRHLISAARGAGIPVIYSAMATPNDANHRTGLWGAKNHRGDEPTHGEHDHEIVRDIAPLPHERVLTKNAPSMFFDTGLIDDLTADGVDSVVICGGTTSGCVYATAVDAFSGNLKVAVIDDACFDRLRLPHDVFLLDLDLKYGDVMSARSWSDQVTTHA